MGRRQRQHPGRRVPACLGEKLDLQHGGQAPGRAAPPDAAVLADPRAPPAAPGPAARLAAMLEVEFLAEAGWDPAARVLSLPAAHPLLGRRLCKVGGCLSTAHATTTGGVCWRCFTRLTGEGLSGQQIASAAELTALT